MLAKWTELLPVFVFKWLARKHCQTVAVSGTDYHTARPDILVKK